jgi:hypothetical protein
MSHNPTNQSTGPRSEAGKQTSSRNATKHGCCSLETLILPNEDIEDFKALESTWFQSYQPRDKAEVHLLNQLVQEDWLFQRSARTVAGIEAQLLAANPNPLNWDDTQHKTLARFLRYQTTHTNTVAKLRRAVEDYRRNRAADSARVVIDQHKEDRLNLAKEKFEFHKTRNPPEKTWEEHIESMTQKVIALGLTPPEF